jgi:hypothetical protein
MGIFHKIPGAKFEYFYLLLLSFNYDNINTESEVSKMNKDIKNIRKKEMISNVYIMCGNAMGKYFETKVADIDNYLLLKAFYEKIIDKKEK